eukprot:8177253-Karenia_brevis.AAC.1
MAVACLQDMSALHPMRAAWMFYYIRPCTTKTLDAMQRKSECAVVLHVSVPSAHSVACCHDRPWVVVAL